MVKVLHQEVIGLGTPTVIGTRGGLSAVSTTVTHTIYLLNVVPLCQLLVNRERTVVLQRHLVLVCLLCRDQDHTMRSTATIKRRSSRPLQDGHVLNVVWVNGRDTVTQIVTTFCASTAKIGVVKWHTVNHVKWLVVTADFGVTTQQHTSRTRVTSSRVLNHKTCHLTRQRVDDISFLSLGQFLTLHFLQRITQRLAVALDAEGCDHHFIEQFLVLAHHNLHALLSFHLLGDIADVANLQEIAGLTFHTKSTINVGNCTSGCADHLNSGTNHWTFGIFYRT